MQQPDRFQTGLGNEDHPGIELCWVRDRTEGELMDTDYKKEQRHRFQGSRRLNKHYYVLPHPEFKGPIPCSICGCLFEDEIHAVDSEAVAA